MGFVEGCFIFMNVVYQKKKEKNIKKKLVRRCILGGIAVSSKYEIFQGFFLWSYRYYFFVYDNVYSVVSQGRSVEFGKQRGF